MTTAKAFRTVLMGMAFVGLLGLAGCQPPPDTYVALGDSYTSGPLIPNQSTQPLGCLRSDHNYAALSAPNIGVPKFTDVSCSGAQTKDMYAAQNVTPGPANPPQLNAVGPADAVVTLGIGGNDIGFSGIVRSCAQLNPLGTPCKNTYVHDGRDEISERIAAVAPKVTAVIQAIKSKATQAKVFVVGYPTILPDSGTGCFPQVPILPADVPYLRAKEQELNAMLASQAAANQVQFVDTYTSSIGHDVCQLPGTRWVEGLVPTSPAAPVHPNAAGMANTARVVTADIRTALGR